MSAISLQVTYRKGQPFAAYIALNSGTRRKSVSTKDVTPDILVDFADDGSPLGIEIVTPGAVAVEDILQVFDESWVSPGQRKPNWSRSGQRRHG